MIKPFTTEQEAKINAEYLTTPIKRLATQMAIHEGRIRRYLKREGHAVPREVVEKHKADSRLKPGNVSFNKGKKQSEYMTPEAIARTVKTRFKKGHTPHNTKPGNGMIVERADKSGRIYQYIRISKAKWELLHRVVWERKHGPIPEGMIITFKDGNSLNCELDNLEQISMEENMLRNSRHDFPYEIIPSMILSKQLDQTIQKRQENG